MTDNTARDALARSLCARLCDARRSHDELRVIDYVLEGIELGADQYGPLNVAKDPRNFRRERAMECRDSLFYAAAEQIQKYLATTSGPSDDRSAADSQAAGRSSDGLNATPAAARGAGT
jgi:hypothetical protein